MLPIWTLQCSQHVFPLLWRGPSGKLHISRLANSRLRLKFECCDRHLLISEHLTTWKFTTVFSRYRTNNVEVNNGMSNVTTMTVVTNVTVNIFVWIFLMLKQLLKTISQYSEDANNGTTTDRYRALYSTFFTLSYLNIAVKNFFSRAFSTACKFDW